MINGKKVLAIIPARGGSKGVPLKNIHMLAGKPLIAWAIESAFASRYIDRCIVSTDDLKIADVSRLFGGDVPFMRPDELARDDTPGIDPVIHAIQEITGYDLVVLLQPTSPLRLSDDIDGCLEKMLESGAKSCVSVSNVNQSPFWMYTVQENGRMKALLDDHDRYATRQSLPDVYTLNGAVYIADMTTIMEKRSFLHADTVAYVMPTERSLDIDDLDDFGIAEMRMSQREER